MSTDLSALFVILVLSAIVFAFAGRPSYEIIPRTDFARRRNLWFALTISLFLANNVWIYILVSGALILITNKKETNPVALFFLLLFLAPMFYVKLPGMGIVNYFVILSHQRVITLVILLPLFFVLARQKETMAFGRTAPDKLLAVYIIYLTILFFRDTTITNSLRQVFYLIIDVLLPYYVVSRFIKNIHGFREAALCFVIAVMILALIGIVELIRNWPLYYSVEILYRESVSYFERAGALRATTTVGPIPLGYAITVGIGFFIYLQYSVRSKFSRRCGMMLLIGGLLASLSRGPWAGAVFLYMVFVASGKRPIQKLAKYGIGAFTGLFLIAVLPLKVNIIELIPFLGTSDQASISYRERLTDKALIVINRNPLFGSANYLETPEMESMRQGQGIIDIVNTYLEITLAYGFVGLCLFVGFFITVCWGIYRNIKRIQDKNSEEHLLGRSLLATLLAILLILVTVSSTSIIPVVYWSVAGLGAAYINLSYPSRSHAKESPDSSALNAIRKVQERS